MPKHRMPRHQDVGELKEMLLPFTAEENPPCGDEEEPEDPPVQG